MSRKTYNKLIRDKIPEIMIEQKVKFEINTLDDKNFKKELLRKIVEES